MCPSAVYYDVCVCECVCVYVFGTISLIVVTSMSKSILGFVINRIFVKGQ